MRFSLLFSTAAVSLLLSACSSDAPDDAGTTAAGAGGNAASTGGSSGGGKGGSTADGGHAGAGTSGASGHAGIAGGKGGSGGAGAGAGTAGTGGHAGTTGGHGGAAAAGGGGAGVGGASAGSPGAGAGGSKGGDSGSPGAGGSGGGDAGGGAGSGGSTDMPGFTMVWSDEFDAPDGSPVDDTIWTHEKGGQGWGNQEREYYTEDTQNSVQMGGNLIITARKLDASTQLSCWYGPCEYTSARLITKSHYSKQYGRLAARIKIPAGQGVWPAFWLLGNNIDQVNWPTCGEIDIMENIGKEPGTVHGTIHGPTPGGGATNYGGGDTLKTGNFADDFHTYIVDWSKDSIAFSIDTDPPYYTSKPSDLKPGETWVFDQPFFLLLNLAIGGQWPGDPDGNGYPKEMRVDWVRVYDKN